MLGRGGRGLRVPVGERDARLFAAGEVPTGKACGCVCPGCGSPLIARNAGQRVRPHFAHVDPTSESAACVETAIHRFAKQVLLEARTLLLPEWKPFPPLTCTDKSGKWHSTDIRKPAVEWTYAEAAAEVWDNGIRPDVVLRDAAGRTLLVEVKVTHGVSETKGEAIRMRGSACIEIDLSALPRTGFGAGEFCQAVLAAPGNRAWVWHPKAEAQAVEARHALRVRIREINAENERKAEQACKLNEKLEAQRESKRGAMREQFYDSIETVAKDGSPEGRAQHLERFAPRDGPEVERLRQRWFGSKEVPQHLRTRSPHDWLIQAHPALWRLALCDALVFGEPAGAEINTRTWVPWLAQRFGLHPHAIRLYDEQKRYTQWARKEGRFIQGRYHTWFLTPEENKAVPSPFELVQQLATDLAQARVLDYTVKDAMFSIAAQRSGKSSGVSSRRSNSDLRVEREKPQVTVCLGLRSV